MKVTGAAALFLLILSGVAEAGEAVSASEEKFVDDRLSFAGKPDRLREA